MAIRFYPQQSRPQSLSPRSKDFEELTLIDLDDPLTPVTAIEADPRYPYRFMQHPVYINYRLIAAQLEQATDIPNVRPLRTHWSTVIPDALIRNGQPVWDDDPLRRPLLVSAGYYTHAKTVRQAYAFTSGGNHTPSLPVFDIKKLPPVPTIKVTTTAGQPIFMQIEEEIRMFGCRKNIGQLPKFMGKGGMFTNSDSVKFQGLDFAPLELLICHIRMSEARFEFRKVYYEFNFDLMVAPDQDGWCEKKRNCGFHEKAYMRVPNGTPGSIIFNTRSYLPYLKAIQIGPPENLQPPSEPVLLSPEGRAFRSPGIGQAPNTPQANRTGPVMSTQVAGSGGVGLTDQDFDNAELRFYPRLAIPFAKYVPLS